MRVPLLLLSVACAVHAQFTTGTSDGKITITGYTGPGVAISIPSTINGLPVTAISASAFQNSEITGVTIPSSVTSIGASAFYECADLVSITVASLNPSYSSAAGVLFNKNKTVLLQFPPGNAETGYVIPSSVTSIGENAFYDASLASVTIPAGVTSIGNYAFPYCPSLASVTIPDSVTSIGAGAFYYCTSLAKVTIPASVTAIGADPFTGCSGLTSITVASQNPICSSVAGVLFNKNETTLILFPPADSATSYAISASVTSIAADAFAGSGLSSITVASQNPNYSSVDGVLFNKKKTTLIQYPEGKSGASYTIPAGVTSIGDYAFYNSSLASVTIPAGVTSIGDYAFAYCLSLGGVTIPAGVTSIGAGAFYDCSSLESVTIPAGITSIGDYEFYGTDLSSVAIPAGVTSIGDYAFDGDGLTSVTIPSGVTSIGTGAFDDCTVLESVTIPSSVTSIGDDAFYNCQFLTSVTIPDSVISIGAEAFSDCVSLTRVTIPGSVTSIGPLAFEGSALISITVASQNPNYSSVDGVLFNKKKTTLIQYPEGKSGASYTIPAGVTSIGDYAFYNSSLASVTIPAGVTSIGDYAFAYCLSLGGVTIPDSVTSIEADAFSSCTELTSVTIPSSVTSIGASPFSDCVDLFSITVASQNPNYSSVSGILFNKNKTTLIEYPAANTDTSYTLPSSVTSVGDYAFFNCQFLSSVTIPASVISIGDSAFSACRYLSSLTIAGGVTSIGASAFYECFLRSVTIPGSVTSIGAGAFSSCTALSTAIFAGNAPAIGAGVFNGDGAGFTAKYYAGATGFTSPTWDGYPSASISRP